jgi:mitochondrial fission protein ELM1
MIGEAAATGSGILVFEPSGGHPKIRAFLEGLQRAGATRPFTGRLEHFSYVPLDSTPIVAAAIRAALATHGLTW